MALLDTGTGFGEGIGAHRRVGVLAVTGRTVQHIRCSPNHGGMVEERRRCMHGLGATCGQTSRLRRVDRIC